MLRMGPASDWPPPIVRTSTLTGEGIDELWDAIDAHRVYQESSGQLDAKRRRRVLDEVKGMVAERLRRRVGTLLDPDDGAEAEVARDLAERKIDPYAAAALLLERLGGDRPHEDREESHG
jgi:LAO/AO transport system kinase